MCMNQHPTTNHRSTFSAIINTKSSLKNLTQKKKKKNYYTKRNHHPLHVEFHRLKSKDMTHRTEYFQTLKTSFSFLETTTRLSKNQTDHHHKHRDGEMEITGLTPVRALPCKMARLTTLIAASGSTSASSTATSATAISASTAAVAATSLRAVPSHVSGFATLEAGTTATSSTSVAPATTSAEMYGVDEKCRSAMSYFFGAFIDLLKQFNLNEDEAKYPEGTPLWEDYELRGFAPVDCVHASLDFSYHLEHIDNYDSGNDCRAQRIIKAAIKIADRSTGSQKWIVYDKSRRKFSKVYMAESNEYADGKEPGGFESSNSDGKLKMPSLHIHEPLKECGKQMIAGENLSSNGQSVDTEEEEVILFRPLTRHNSAPLKISSTLKDPYPTKDMADQSVPSDECLRRATSLLIAQNQAKTDPLSFHADITNFRRNMPFKQQEPSVKEQPFLETPITAGPPSLNAWVLDIGNLNSNTEKSTSKMSKCGSSLSPIEELASEYLDVLSINENEYSISSHEISSTHSSSSTYTTPVPSAPLLPDDAVWFDGGTESSFSDCKSSAGISMTDNLCDANASHSQAGSYANWTATQALPDYSSGILNFMDKYPPWHRMTSSEWLRQYRESLNLGHHAWPNSLYPPSNPGNLYDYDASRLNHFNRWGHHAASNPPMQMNNLPLNPPFPGYQRPIPYGCGAVTDVRNEQQPLLQYLKEKERKLQHDPAARGPSYMDN